MITAGSRYEASEHNFVLSHLYSKRGFPLVQGEEGLTSLKVSTALREALYRMQTEPDPAGETTNYYAKEFESFQFLGHKILSDPRRWWELADLNPQVWYPLDLKPGDVLTVPLA